MLKHELRTLYKAKRKALQNRTLLSEQLAEHFFANFNWQAWDNFHLFLPITKMREVETRFIYQKLWAAQKQIFCPVITSNIMQSVPFFSEQELQTSAWGIPEPIGEAKKALFSVVFVPLLCADVLGNRVGYGKGFYDDFMAGLGPQTLKIGLNFFAPHAQIIQDIRPEDIRLDYLLSPEGVASFTSKSMK
jgi:5-formyltetrahydrofolate cyclo-ligase